MHASNAPDSDTYANLAGLDTSKSLLSIDEKLAKNLNAPCIQVSFVDGYGSFECEISSFPDVAYLLVLEANAFVAEEDNSMRARIGIHEALIRTKHGFISGIAHSGTTFKVAIGCAGTKEAGTLGDFAHYLCNLAKHFVPNVQSAGRDNSQYELESLPVTWPISNKDFCSFTNDSQVLTTTEGSDLIRTTLDDANGNIIARLCLSDEVKSLITSTTSVKSWKYELPDTNDAFELDTILPEITDEQKLELINYYEISEPDISVELLQSMVAIEHYFVNGRRTMHPQFAIYMMFWANMTFVECCEWMHRKTNKSGIQGTKVTQEVLDLMKDLPGEHLDSVYKLYQIEFGALKGKNCDMCSGHKHSGVFCVRWPLLFERLNLMRASERCVSCGQRGCLNKGFTHADLEECVMCGLKRHVDYLCSNRYVWNKINSTVNRIAISASFTNSWTTLDFDKLFHFLKPTEAGNLRDFEVKHDDSFY